MVTLIFIIISNCLFILYNVEILIFMLFIAIKTGPCINNAITTLEMNFGMIYLSVFGTNCSIRFSSGPDISIPVYEVNSSYPLSL